MNIEISLKDLKKLAGNIEIEKVQQYSKLEIAQSEDNLIVEVKDSNRPDLLSVEGIARELKGSLGKEKGLAKYTLNRSDFVLNAGNVGARSEIVCAVIKNIKLDDFAIKQIIQLQEKLCEGYGRKRKEAAVGIYDFDKIKWPILYKQANPDSVKFIPLEMNEELTLRQILARHPTGRDYAKLLENESEYPLIIDSADEVLSMPPIINSNYSGKVTESTKNLFVEVTGFDREKIMLALNIVIAALADRNGEIYSVTINKSGKKFASPEFKTKKKTLSVEDVNERLGLNLSAAQIVSLLEKARYSAKANKNKIEVETPFYRADIIHTVDIIEDIAIAYGYHNFSVEEPKIFTVGSTLEDTKLSNKVANLMAGLEFQEIMSFVMSNKEDLFKKMDLKEESIIEIENPASQTYSGLRNWLLPSLMNMLSQNTTKNYPQKIFEIGNAVMLNEKSEVKSDTVPKFSAAIASNSANFTDIKQVLDYIMKNLGLEYEFVKSKHSSLIEGRCGEIIINKKKIGILGEVSPKVLSNWNIDVPVAVFEIDVSKI